MVHGCISQLYVGIVRRLMLVFASIKKHNKLLVCYTTYMYADVEHWSICSAALTCIHKEQLWNLLFHGSQVQCIHKSTSSSTVMKSNKYCLTYTVTNKPNNWATYTYTSLRIFHVGKLSLVLRDH